MALLKHKMTAKANEEMLPHNLNLPVVESEDISEQVAMVERLMEESWQWEEKFRKMKEKHDDLCDKGVAIDDARHLIWKREVAYQSHRRQKDMDMDVFNRYIENLHSHMNRGTFTGTTGGGEAVFRTPTNEHWVMLKAMKVRAEYLDDADLARQLSGSEEERLMIIGGDREGLTMGEGENGARIIVGITKERFLDFYEKKIYSVLKRYTREIREKRAKRIIADGLWDSPGAKRALWRIRAQRLGHGDGRFKNQVVKRIRRSDVHHTEPKFRWGTDLTLTPVRVAWLREQLVDVFHAFTENGVKDMKKPELLTRVVAAYRYEGHREGSGCGAVAFEVAYR